VSTGVGGLTHLASELFLNMTNLKVVHVPYKSTGAAMTELLAGQVPINIGGSLLPIMPYLESGKLRALGVTTEKRWYSLPNVPTVAESVPGYVVEVWFGTMVPRGTPRPIIDRLNAAINKALQQPDMKKNLEIQGLQGTGGTPEKFGERITKDYKRWLKVIQDANIKVE
jgi:tripartite-type tricarboxylate transporter receptor subunit TctC